MALMQARDERFTFITCDHKGTYADDVGSLLVPWSFDWLANPARPQCIVDRIQKHRIYIVAVRIRPALRFVCSAPLTLGTDER